MCGAPGLHPPGCSLRSRGLRLQAPGLPLSFQDMTSSKPHDGNSDPFQNLHMDLNPLQYLGFFQKHLFPGMALWVFCMLIPSFRQMVCKVGIYFKSAHFNAVFWIFNDLPSFPPFLLCFLPLFLLFLFLLPPPPPSTREGLGRAGAALDHRSSSPFRGTCERSVRRAARREQGSQPLAVL